MMTHELQVSVLSAPLAAIDRRALSQAWYSALQLASDRDAQPVVSRPRRRGAQKESAAPKRSGSAPGDAAALPPKPAARTSAPAARPQGAMERRAPRLPVARAIVRAFSRSSVQPRRTTVVAGKQRIALMLHSAAAGPALVAICTPAMRDAVARALAQARFALAARGVALRAEVKQCS